MTKFYKITLEQIAMDRKISNIKELRAATGNEMSLTEAKNLVEDSRFVTIVLSDAYFGRYVAHRMMAGANVFFYMNNVEDYTPSVQPPIFG